MHDVFSGALNTISGYLIEYFLRLAVAVVILLVGFKVSAFLSKRFLKLEKKEHVDEAAVSFIRSAVDIAFKTIVIVSARGSGRYTDGFDYRSDRLGRSSNRTCDAGKSVEYCRRRYNSSYKAV